MTAQSVFAGLAQDAHLADGSLRGVATPLVRLPVDVFGYETNGTIGLQSSVQNSDGSGVTASLSIAAGPAGTVGYFRQKVGGRVVGVRWRGQDTTTTTAPFFDVVIDGEAYAVDRGPLRMNNTPATAGRSDYSSQHIVDAALSDRAHTVEVVVSPDATGGSTRVLGVFGFIAEQGRYQVPPPAERGSTIAQATTLGTTAASVPFTNQSVGLRLRNTDTVSRIVTVYMSSGTAAADIYTQQTLTAGAEISVPFPRARSMSGWKWKADAAGVVYGMNEEI